MSISVFVVALLVGVIVMSCLVAWRDLKTRRIPNLYLVWGVCYALAVFATMSVYLPFGDVIKGFLFSLFGVFLGGVFLYVPYRYKQVGAGDVKLMMVYGLFLGPKGVVLALLNGALVGGVWALALAWKHGGLSNLWYNMKFMAQSVWLSGGKEMSWNLRSENAIAMPYGVALAVGAISVALWQLHLHMGRLLA